MEALKDKYEQNRAEVLKSLDVSKDLLEVMTRHGLIDIADCVKYQGIHDTKKRNGSLMKTMVERRTERAYPLFIQSLRQAGQDNVANLLTDIGEETRIITHLQSDLEREIGSISDYIKQEEKRTGTTRRGKNSTTAGEKAGGGKKIADGMTTNGGHSPDPHLQPPPPLVPTSDREVWVGVQSTLKRAGGQLDRCRAVIDKLHEDCQQLALTNGDMVSQVRNCYSRVRRMLKPGQTTSQAEAAMPKTTQAMFQNLIDDVEKLMSRKTRAQQEENEGRTNAMRMLRHLRDWIQERSSILDTLHASSAQSSPRVSRLPLLSSRRDTSTVSGTAGGGSNLQLHAHGTPPFPRHSSPRQHSPSSPPSRSHDTSDERGISPVTYLGETGGPGQGRGQSQGQGPGHEAQQAEYIRHVEPYAISTVLDGLHVLEQQVRQYVHMEILLTDKFRSEMRYRHLRRKSHGYTPKGLEEAQRALERLEAGSHVTHNATHNGRGGHGGGGGGGGDDRSNVIKLRASVDAMVEEYNACAAYLGRMANSMNKIHDVDAFLSQADDSRRHHHHHHHHKNKNAEHKDDKDRKNRQTIAHHDKQQTSFFSGIFSRGKKDTSSPIPFASSSSKSPAKGFRPASNGLPTLATHVNHEAGVGEDPPLLGQVKVLVANYEMIKLKLKRLEDRYRREFDQKRRAFEATLQAKEDEIASLRIALKETEAEKEKFRGLYDKMKVSYAQRR